MPSFNLEPFLAIFAYFLNDRKLINRKLQTAFQLLSIYDLFRK